MEIRGNSMDETITSKEQWYDLKTYKDEICSFVRQKKVSLNCIAQMEREYDRLYKTVYAGTEESDIERFPHTAEVFKVYKAAVIEACLQGYSALFVPKGKDAYSVLKVPDLVETMTDQFKSMALIENLSDEVLDDWILKGEACGFIKLKTSREEYRIKETLTDAETGEPVVKFTLKQGVEYEDIDFQRIDPLDVFIDANDYKRDPLGCVKIVRSYITPETLLLSNAYPMLSKEIKKEIADKYSTQNNASNYSANSTYITEGVSYSSTRAAKIEVLTFRGDYVTTDGKVLKNIVAVIVDGQIADLKYSEVSTNRFIYAAYKVDRLTHRGISPLASSNPVNKLLNRAIDMFLKNLEDISNPYIMYAKGSVGKQDYTAFRQEKRLEYNESINKPEFWSPPPAAMQGLDLMNLILTQNKNMLGLNSYISGDASGAVRTAKESAALIQRSNARMRVETDVFSYNFMLRFFTAFYAFNRELALAADHPLAEIYSDPQLKVSISTNASRADETGELNMLMQMLNLPIAQMIFSNLTPQQTILALRYLMAKAGLKDADNLLELTDGQGNTTQLAPTDGNGNVLPVAEEMPTVPDVPPMSEQMNIDDTQAYTE